MQLFDNFNLSLTTKLIVTSVVVETVLLSFLIWNDTKLTQSQLLVQKQEEISELATFIASTVASALNRNNMQDIFTAIKLIGTSPKINYAAIKTLNDQTIAQTGVSKQSKPTNQDLLDYIKSTGHTDSYHIIISLDANQTVLGRLHLEFSIDDVDRLLTDVQRRHIINAFIIIVVTVVILYVLLSALTGNLKNLTLAMTEYINSQHISTPLVRSNDEVGKLSATFENLITTIRDGKESLKESEENLRSLANNAIDGILVNKKGKHVFTNQRMADMLNTTVDEIIGTTQDYVLHPSERDNVVQRFKQRLKGQNEPIQYETLFVDKKTGDPLPVELSAFISQWDGEPSGVVFVRDIKERKKTEAELISYRERLEHMVSERTAELESAIRELESFSYSVSHDLRSPLRSIDGFSKLLLEDYQNKLDERGTDYLNRVRKAAQRMAQLIDDILLLSRVSRHKLAIENVDLSQIAEESVASLQELYPERNIEIKIEPNMEIKADRSLLRIVMDNLLDNAWKYSSKNDYAIVECGYTRENGRTVFYVKDNGVGFDMCYVQKLFGAFQRLHGIDEFPGTGIGLATVKRIVDRHGGKVWAEGKPGEGAAFYFTLA